MLSTLIYPGPNALRMDIEVAQVAAVVPSGEVRKAAFVASEGVVARPAKDELEGVAVGLVINRDG